MGEWGRRVASCTCIRRSLHACAAELPPARAGPSHGRRWEVARFWQKIATERSGQPRTAATKAQAFQRQEQSGPQLARAWGRLLILQLQRHCNAVLRLLFLSLLLRQHVEACGSVGGGHETASLCGCGLSSHADLAAMLCVLASRSSVSSTKQGSRFH